MLRNIHLYGCLGKRFGEHHRFDVDSVGEGIRALGSQFPGFLGAIRNGSYQIIRGEDLDGEQMSEPMLGLILGKQDLHIVPVVEGAKDGSGKAIITAVLGVALIATGYGMAAVAMQGTEGMALGAAMQLGWELPAGLGTLTYAQVAIFGAALALGGIWQLVCPVPKSNYNDRGKDKTSFIFNGPVNRLEQGGAIQLVYGRFTVGSTVVSAGISTEDIAAPDMQFQITASGDANITPAVASIMVTYSKVCQVKFTPKAGYTIDKMLVDGVETKNYKIFSGTKSGVVNYVAYTFQSVKEAHTISATSRAVKPNEYPVIDTDPDSSKGY